jgi:hypothetical protein
LPRKHGAHVACCEGSLLEESVQSGCPEGSPWWHCPLTLPRQPPSVPAPAPPLRARWHTGQAVEGARQLLGRSGVWWGRWDATPPPVRHGYLEPGRRPPHRGIAGRRVNRSRHGMHALPDRLHRGPFLRVGPWVIPEAEFLRPGRPRASRGSASSRQELGCAGHIPSYFRARYQRQTP